MSSSSLKVIKPIAITEAMLVSCSAAENEYPNWDSNAVYAQDQYVQFKHKVYRAKDDEVHRAATVLTNILQSSAVVAGLAIISGNPEILRTVGDRYVYSQLMPGQNFVARYDLGNGNTCHGIAVDHATGIIWLAVNGTAPGIYAKAVGATSFVLQQLISSGTLSAIAVNSANAAVYFGKSTGGVYKLSAPTTAIGGSTAWNVTGLGVNPKSNDVWACEGGLLHIQAGGAGSFASCDPAVATLSWSDVAVDQVAGDVYICDNDLTLGGRVYVLVGGVWAGVHPFQMASSAADVDNLSHVAVDSANGGLVVSSASTPNAGYVYYGLGGLIGFAPDQYPEYWELVGATNRWKALDLSSATQTTALDTLSYSLRLGRVDSVNLINCRAWEAVITVTSDSDGVVYNKTIKLLDTSEITDLYQYFNAETLLKQDLVLLDIPPYSDATLTITLNHAGSEVRLGQVVAGMQKDCGFSQSGISVGSNNWTIVNVDGWGNWSIVPRGFARRMSLRCRVPSNRVDIIVRRLNEYRYSPALYVATERYSSTFVFGLYTNFEEIIKSGPYSECSLEINGLLYEE